MLTLSETLDHIRHTLRSDLSSELQAIRVIDQAGQHLLNMHQWRFTNPPPVSLSLVANQSYVALPADFGEAGMVASSNTTDTYGFEWVTLDQIAQMRSSAFGSAYGAYYGAIAFPIVNNIPSPRIEIYPTPQSNQADAFRMTYRRRWVTPSGDRGVMPIPGHLEALFIQIIRAFARGYEEEDQATLDERLALIQSGPIYKNALASDGTVQPSLGTLPMRQPSGAYRHDQYNTLPGFLQLPGS